jgi:sugar porter (SP) family MFS transporter
MRSNSNKRILNKVPLKNNQPTKNFRMKSLLWTKPTLNSEQLSASLWAQIVPTLLVNLAALSSGLSLGYSAIALPQLKPELDGEEDHYYDSGYSHLFHNYRPFTLDDDSGSWVASVFGIGAIFGGFGAAYLGAKLGRRRALLFLSVPDMAGWILIAAAQNPAAMLAGRFLCGFAVAGYSPCIQVYISEIAQPHHRGWLGGLTVPILSLGMLCAYALGSTLSWHWVAVIACAFPVFLAVSLLFLEDTPYWYLAKGDERKALEVMLKYRESNANALAELLCIAETLRPPSEDQPEIDELGREVDPSAKLSLEQLSRRRNRRPFVLLNVLFLLMTFSGKFAISFYAVEIFHNAASKTVNEYYAAVIIGFIQLLGSVLFIPAVKMFSRRFLLCLSALIMGISLSVLGMAMYSHSHHHDLSHTTDPAELAELMSKMDVDWLPLLCIITYMIADPIGVGSIPFLYTAEFFPSQVRSLLSGITIGMANLEMFILVKTFPNLNASMGHHGTFWLYAGVCFATIVYVLLYIPETRGKTLQEIESLFSFKENLHVTPLPGTPVLNRRRNTNGSIKSIPRHHAGYQFTL